MKTKPTPGEIVVMAAGVLGLIASFLPFYKIEFAGPAFDLGDLGDLDLGLGVGFETGGSEEFSAWSTDLPFLFPVATLIAVFVVAAAVIVALVRFTNIDLSAGFLGFGLNHLVLALAFFPAVLALSYLIQDFPGVDLSVGYWLLLIAAIGSVVGAVLMMNEARSGAPGVPPPPPPPPTG